MTWALLMFLSSYIRLTMACRCGTLLSDSSYNQMDDLFPDMFIWPEATFPVLVVDFLYVKSGGKVLPQFPPIEISAKVHLNSKSQNDRH